MIQSWHKICYHIKLFLLIPGLNVNIVRSVLLEFHFINTCNLVKQFREFSYLVGLLIRNLKTCFYCWIKCILLPLLNLTGWRYISLVPTLSLCGGYTRTSQYFLQLKPLYDLTAAVSQFHRRSGTPRNSQDHLPPLYSRTTLRQSLLQVVSSASLVWTAHLHLLRLYLSPSSAADFDNVNWISDSLLFWKNRALVAILKKSGLQWRTISWFHPFLP